MKKLIIITLISIMILGTNVFAQNPNLESQLLSILIQNYGEEYLKGYTQPFVTAFGTGMGGAWYHRAYTKGFPRLDVGVSAVYLTVPDEAKTFTFGLMVLMVSVARIVNSSLLTANPALISGKIITEPAFLRFALFNIASLVKSPRTNLILSLG